MTAFGKNRLLGLFASLVCISSQLAAEEEPDTLMLLGNQMFRGGSYSAAIKYYDRVVDADEASPLLYYNKGVAHYKLRQYSLATKSLKDAAKSEKLKGLAYYNLGLVSRAQQDYLVARGWFEAVIDMDSNPKLRQLASKALIRVAKAESKQVIQARDQYKKQKKPKLGDFDFQALVTVGTDDNVYRTPDQAYVDLSAPGQPQINPVVQSSQVKRLKLKTAYEIPVFEHTSFQLNYSFDGSFYESDFSNANALRHRVSLDAKAILGLNKPRPRRLHAAFVAVDHDENNFDPDTGLDRIVDGQDVSGRFSYRGIGPVAEYRHDLGRWGYGFDIKTELRTYDEFVGLPAYNHNYFSLTGHFVHRLTQKLRLRGEYGTFVRDYSDRPARDLTGAQLLTNQSLKYSYAIGDLSLRYRLFNGLLLDAGYRFTDRKDEYLGYNDYTQGAYRLAVNFRPNRRLRFYGSYSNRSYDYPRAFAFDTLAGGPRDLDIATLRGFGEYRITRRFSVWAEIRGYDVSSTDARALYDKRVTTIGLKTRL